MCLLSNTTKSKHITDFKLIPITLLSLFLSITGQLTQAAPCEVNPVAEGAYLFDSTGAMVITPDNKWLLVLDDVASNLKVIETSTQQVMTTLDLLGSEPGGIAISPDGATVYVSGAFDGNIITIDISDSEPNQWITTPAWQIEGDLGTMQVDSRNTSQLLVTDRKINGIRILSTIDGSEQAILSTEYCNLPADLLQHDSLLFVACETSNKIAVFNLETKEHLKSINVGNAPVSLLLHPSQPNLYVANLQGGTISIINTESLELIKLDLSNHNVLNTPRNMIWLDNTIWILDRSNASLIRLDPRTEEFKSGVCTISSQPSHLIAAISPQQRTIYTAHSNGVDYLSINIPKARLQSQVLMAGFDPILFDIQDTKFKVLAIVLEGLAPLDSVSVEQNTGAIKRTMTLMGSIPLTVEDGRQVQGLVYEAEFEIDRGVFPEGTVATEVMGLPVLSLFGNLSNQFYIRSKDEAEQKHSYPLWKYGNWPLIEKEISGTEALTDNYTKHGPRRYHPQVIMAGFTPMLMDIGDTEVKVLAIVRQGSAKIKHVTLMESGSSTLMTTMTKVSDLPNGDELYQGTVITQRGTPLFETDVEFSNIWNDMFHIEVIDEAQQQHRFPNFHVGNYPEPLQ